MNIDHILEFAVQELKANNCRFALAGGIAASVYRTQIRVTTDVDMLIWSARGSLATAREIIEKLGFSVATATLAQLSKAPRMGKRSLPTLLVVGREHEDKSSGLDFILPEMPWFENAIERAQYNLLDFGCGTIPTLTAEDIIISKLFAVANTTSRYEDLSDIKGILENQENRLDLPYLAAEMDRLKLAFPKDLESLAPCALKVLSKRIRNLK